MKWVLCDTYFFHREFRSGCVCCTQGKHDGHAASSAEEHKYAKDKFGTYRKALRDTERKTYRADCGYCFKQNICESKAFSLFKQADQNNRYGNEKQIDGYKLRSVSYVFFVQSSSETFYRAFSAYEGE